MNKYENIGIEIVRKLINKDIKEEEIINLVEIYNEEDLEMFFACVDKYKVTEKHGTALIYDLFVYKNENKYCFIENDSKCNIDESKIIDEWWYSLGYDYEQGAYVVQFERV